MLCVLILYISGGTPNDRFEKLFMAILFTLRVFARNLLRGNRRRNTFLDHGYYYVHTDFLLSQYLFFEYNILSVQTHNIRKILN